MEVEQWHYTINSVRRILIVEREHTVRRKT